MVVHEINEELIINKGGGRQCCLCVCVEGGRGQQQEIDAYVYID